MAGYDSERFEGLTEADKQELSCAICRNILCEPLITECCQMAFCKHCIEEWIQDNPNCPFCRHLMNRDNLNLSSRILQNRLKSLRISCDNKDRGCQEVMPLGDLATHLRNCPFKVILCEECFKSQCVLQSGHECIKEVIQHMNELREENERLRALPNHNQIGRQVEWQPIFPPRVHQVQFGPIQPH